MSDKYQGPQTPDPDKEKEEQIEYGTGWPDPRAVTNADGGSERPQR